MVAVVDTSVTDDELRRLHGLGVRGIRFNLVQTGATTPEMLEPLSRRVHALGWHCQVHMLGDQIAEAAAVFERLPSRIVFDHLGRIPMDRGVNHPAYGVIRRLMDRGNTWVKLSGAYMDSKAGAAGNYADTVPVARGYAMARRSAASGLATGRTSRSLGTSRTMRGCLTCWPNGCRTSAPAPASWWTTPRSSTTSRAG